MATKDGVRAALKLLIGAGVRPPEGSESAVLTALWEVHLGDLDDDALKRAVVLWAGSSSWWPTPAQLREALGAPVAPRLDAEAAWERCMRGSAYHPPLELGGNGAHGAPWSLHPDPEIAQLIAGAIRSVGGWRELRMCETEHLVHRRRDFLAYLGTCAQRLAREGKVAAIEGRKRPTLSLLPGGLAVDEIDVEAEARKLANARATR